MLFQASAILPLAMRAITRPGTSGGARDNA